MRGRGSCNIDPLDDGGRRAHGAPTTLGARRIGARALVLLAGAAPAARSYSDRLGDVEGGAGPDIVSVVLSHTKTTLTFRVAFAHAPPLRVSVREKWVDMLLIGIDVPPARAAPDRARRRVARRGLRPRHARPVADRQAREAGDDGRGEVAPGAQVRDRHPPFTVAAARQTEQATGGGVDLAPDRGTFRYAFSG
jgi:hypothetical protein